MENDYDWVIKGGRVIDPINGIDEITDVAIKAKIIAKVGSIEAEKGQKVFDAKDCLVVPGLIDCHVHVYQHCTQLGVNADENCLARGKLLIILFFLLFSWISTAFDIF